MGPISSERAARGAFDTCHASDSEHYSESDIYSFIFPQDSDTEKHTPWFLAYSRMADGTELAR
jgi:hypothetical protein